MCLASRQGTVWVRLSVMAANEPIDYTTDGIQAVMEQLKENYEELEVVIEQMKARSLDVLSILYAKEMRRGLKKVDAFSRAASSAMTDYRIDVTKDGNGKSK